MAWGLAFATVLTLVVMPCFYAIIDDATVKLTRHGTVFVKNNNKKHKKNIA